MNGNTFPQYSVLMSVYSGEKPANFREAVMSMLKQTVRPSQFVIVCDGPLGDSLDSVLDDFVKADSDDLFDVIRLNENVGLGRALSAGLAACCNEYVARMDSDDIAFPERCELQLNEMVKNHLQLISGFVLEFAGDTNNVISIRKVPTTQKEIIEFSKKRNPFNHPCVMFEKAAVLKVGGYQDMYRLEDYYLWVRMLADGCRAANIAQPVLYMRSDEGMYGRRGGVAYGCAQVKLLKYMKSTGYIGALDLIIMGAARFVLSIVPTSLRRAIYGKFAREKS